MECFINDKKIRLNPFNMKYSKEISTIKGTTSNVYLIEDKAYKLYRLPYLKEDLSKEMISTMKTIPTKRVILPEEAILDKHHHVVGTISTYIKDLGVDNLLSLPRKDLIEELKLLKEDFIALGSSKIKVNDLFLRNFVFHNGMYFIDVGKFYFLDMPSDIVISKNIDELNLFLIDRFLIPLASTYSKNKSLTSRKIKEDFYKNIENIPIDKTLQADFTEENLEKYLIKRAHLK